jgi:type II secretion system protein G
MKLFYSRRRGFTLIELLVVIAIIGLLASIILASLNTARAKARDAKRIAEMHEISNALHLYYLDNGHYPYTPYPTSDPNVESWSTSLYPANFLPDLAPYFSGGLPTYPTNTPIS